MNTLKSVHGIKRKNDPSLSHTANACRNQDSKILCGCLDKVSSKNSCLCSHPWCVTRLGQFSSDTGCQEVVPAVDSLSNKTSLDVRCALCAVEPGCTTEALLIVTVSESQDSLQPSVTTCGARCSDSLRSGNSSGVLCNVIRHSHHAGPLSGTTWGVVLLVLESNGLKSNIGNKCRLLSRSRDAIRVEGFIESCCC